jgi:hypothetical protein
VSWGPNRIDVFRAGRQGLLEHAWWGGRGWHDWGRPYFYIAANAGLAAASWAENRLDVFVSDLTIVRHIWWDGTAWRGPETVGPAGFSSLAAVSWGPERIDLFGIQAGELWHRYWTPSARPRKRPPPTSTTQTGTQRIPLYPQQTYEGAVIYQGTLSLIGHSGNVRSLMNPNPTVLSFPYYNTQGSYEELSPGQTMGPDGLFRISGYEAPALPTTFSAYQGQGLGADATTPIGLTVTYTYT